MSQRGSGLASGSLAVRSEIVWLQKSTVNDKGEIEPRYYYRDPAEPGRNLNYFSVDDAPLFPVTAYYSQKSAGEPMFRALWTPQRAFFASRRAPDGSFMRISGEHISHLTYVHCVNRSKTRGSAHLFAWSSEIRRLGLIRVPSLGRDHLGRLKSKFNRYIPINEFIKSISSPDFKFVGSIPERIGIRPPSIVPKNANFLAWANSYRTLFTEAEAKAIFTNRVMLSGGLGTSYSIMYEYAMPTVKVHYSTYEYLDILIEEGFPWIKLPKMDAPHIDDLARINFKPKSIPGFYTKRFFGKSRGESCVDSYQVARYIFEKAHKKFVKNVSLWEISGRGKDCKEVDPSDTNPAARLVWQPEEWLSILTSAIVQPFVAKLKHIDENCIFIGKNFGSKTADWIRRLKERYMWSVRSDWKHFDAYHHESIVLAAAEILRMCYPPGREIDRYFTFLTQSVIHKHVVLPPGIVFESLKGMPSGHSLMNILNTLINYIQWVVILRKVYGPGKVHSRSYGIFSGDDSLLFLDDDERIYQIDRIVKENSLYRSDPIVPNINLSVERDPDNQSLFLKRYINTAGIISWDTKGMLRKFVNREDAHYSLEEETTWVESQLRTGPGDGRLYQIMLAYLVHRCGSDQERIKEIRTRLSVANRTGLNLALYRLPYPYFKLGLGAELTPDTFDWFGKAPLSRYIVRNSDGSLSRCMEFAHYMKIMHDMKGIHTKEEWSDLINQMSNKISKEYGYLSLFSSRNKSKFRREIDELLKVICYHFDLYEYESMYNKSPVSPNSFSKYRPLLLFFYNKNGEKPYDLCTAISNYVVGGHVNFKGYIKDGACCPHKVKDPPP